MSEYGDALKKKALGYNADEVVEEYASVDGKLELIKRKVTIKHVPPDLSALKMIIDEDVNNMCEMSEQELIEERGKLLKELKEIYDETRKT
ncbi:MAG: hypothetical protein J6W87_03940 [Clostridia bacterium]|nr:hypothetical protein [Clostridia bacterium]